MSSGTHHRTLRVAVFTCRRLYFQERDYATTLPRPGGMHSAASNFSASPASVARDPRHNNNKPQKSKSFMSSLKHLTLPRRKNREKDRLHNDSMSSQASSTSQLNTSVPLPASSAVSHSLSSGTRPCSTHVSSMSLYSLTVITFYSSPRPTSRYVIACLSLFTA